MRTMMTATLNIKANANFANKKARNFGFKWAIVQR